MIHLSHPYTTTGKTIALTRWTVVSKVMSLLFNTPFMFAAGFLPRRKSFNFMAAVTVCSDFGAYKRKSVTASTFSSSTCHKVMGPDAMIFFFWMLSFNPAFSFSSFTLIKRLFSSSSLSAFRVESSTYLRLIFLLEILISVYDSSSPTFYMMYSAFKLNKQGNNIQPCCTLFPNLNQSIIPCLVLTVASWPTYRFLRR